MPATNLAAAITADTPSGYWKLEDAAGASAIVDTSGVSGSGTPQSGVHLGYPCSWGTCAWFDGTTNAWVQLPNNLGFSSAGLTLEALVAVTNSDVWQRILELQNAASSSAGVNLIARGNGTPANTPTAAANGGNVPASNPPPDVGRWYHFMATISAAGAVSWYINGAARGTGTTGAPATSGTRSMCYLGRSVWPADPYLSALLGHVAWYPTVLTAARATAHYNAWQTDVATAGMTSVAWDYSSRVVGASRIHNAFLYKGRDTALNDSGSSP